MEEGCRNFSLQKGQEYAFRPAERLELLCFHASLTKFTQKCLVESLEVLSEAITGRFRQGWSYGLNNVYTIATQFAIQSTQFTIDFEKTFDRVVIRSSP